MRTILQQNNCRNSRSKVEWKKNSVKKNEKFVYTLRGCPLFWKFLKMPLFLSLMEIAENSNRTFWLKGKRRKNIPACQMKFQNLKQNK